MPFFARILARPSLWIGLCVVVFVSLLVHQLRTMSDLVDRVPKQAFTEIRTEPMQVFRSSATTPDGIVVEVETTCGTGESQADCLARHLAAIELIRSGGVPPDRR